MALMPAVTHGTVVYLVPNHNLRRLCNNRSHPKLVGRINLLFNDYHVVYGIPRYLFSPLYRHQSVLNYCGSLSAIRIARSCRPKIVTIFTVATAGAREGTPTWVNRKFLLMYFVRIAEEQVEHGRIIVSLVVEILLTYIQIVLRLERDMDTRVLPFQFHGIVAAGR